jgi:hypothetical protein
MWWLFIVTLSALTIFIIYYSKTQKEYFSPMTHIPKNLENTKAFQENSGLSVLVGKDLDEEELPPERKRDEYPFRDPMLKSCMERKREWPLNYRLPYNDPLFSMMTTNLYTSQNADPENLTEVRQWQHVL